jgi:CP family cyanate transporter-like MFS transporter
VPVFNAASGSAATGHVAAGSAAVRVTLALWAAPALVAALIWIPQLRYATFPDSLPRHGRGRQVGALALRRNALAWQVTLFMGLQSLCFYAALSWFPTMFRDRGVSAAHAGVLLALMNLGNGVTALALPMLAHRSADQRRLAAVSVAAMAAGLVGAVWGPGGLAAESMVLLGLGQGASLGLGIFYTMARAPDPVSSASLSGFAQGIGYLIASAGPLAIGVVHEATGSWTVPGLILLLVAGLQLITGWLAGRAVTLPAMPASAWTPPAAPDGSA